MSLSLPPDTEVLWSPHPGPQSRFLASTAYEKLYGGAAGGGKTDALLYGGLRQIHHPQYRALFIRETFPELREVMDRALGTFRRLGGVWNEQAKRWTFPSGATYEFGYCQSYADVLRYQGQEFTRIAWDELGQCPEERRWTYLMSRNRTTAPDLTLSMEASANPGGAGHAWLKRRFIVPCGVTGGTVRDPVTGLTRAYVPAKLSDNPSLPESYRQTLLALDEVTRRQLLDGDWDAGEGLALSELRREVHLIPEFPIPAHWFRWGAFDWGYNHPFAFGDFALDEDGTAYLVNSVHGRRLYPEEIVARIQGGCPDVRWRYIAAGHDCWNEVKARGEGTPTIAEHFHRAGLSLKRANVSRVTGLNNLRQYVKHGPDRPPRFYVLDTPGNRRTWDVLEGMVTDPDHLEDALKVDADPHGQGGDDAYDMVRYGLAERPLRMEDPAKNPEPRAFSPDQLKLDAERQRSVKWRLDRRRKPSIVDPHWGEL